MQVAEIGQDDVLELTPAELRMRIRRGAFDRGTAGLADGYMQGNVVILPQAMAGDFHAFCRANPAPCPLLAVSQVGDPSLPTLGDVDIRTDVPRYYVYRDGKLDTELPEIGELWRDDFVAFVLGCSLGFEAPLIAAGIPMRHIELRRLAPMYRTNIATQAAGPFGGDLVVSMRPMTPADAIRAVELTSRFPDCHGAPVHLAEPQHIGISDLDAPDWGDPPQMRDGEIPVFWACGVTPQVAIERARPEICITHKPGHMLVTDLANGANDAG